MCLHPSADAAAFAVPDPPQAVAAAMLLSPTTARAGLPALVFGAVLIGFAAIIVRLVDIGPTAAAAWRLAVALPALALLNAAAAARGSRAPRHDCEAGGRRAAIGLMLLAGVAFGCDLALWHRAIHLTSVANATLMSNLSPVFVALTLHFGLRQHHPRGFWLGLALALAGALALVADSATISPATAIGDLLAIATAGFYAIYQLLVSRCRQRGEPATVVMGWAAVGGLLLLLPLTIVAGERWLPTTARDAVLLAALGVVVHVGGQGLIAWAQAHVTASFASVTLLVQPVAAAVFAWALLGEGFGVLQGFGGLLIVAGILLCRRATPPSAARPSS